MGFNLWLISTKTKSSQQNKSHFCLFVFFLVVFTQVLVKNVNALFVVEVHLVIKLQ